MDRWKTAEGRECGDDGGRRERGVVNLMQDLASKLGKDRKATKRLYFNVQPLLTTMVISTTQHQDGKSQIHRISGSKLDSKMSTHINAHPFQRCDTQTVIGQICRVPQRISAEICYASLKFGRYVPLSSILDGNVERFQLLLQGEVVTHKEGILLYIYQSPITFSRTTSLSVTWNVVSVASSSLSTSSLWTPLRLEIH
ncbi:hypothetical protein BJ165DRAFT_1410400 [Panaeolus papilionaceus]|nr:hypothetical protein BJ165DRAFT_1410400 [Panaeolus papilionaceus]